MRAIAGVLRQGAASVQTLPDTLEELMEP